jgi:hypothetical protein
MGLRPVSGDPDIKNVNPHWIWGNFPERMDGRLIPEELNPNQIITDLVVTRYAKYNLVVPEKAEPFLLMYPIQAITPKTSEAEDGIRRLEVEAESSGRRHEAALKRRILDGGKRTFIFRHRDSDTVLGLVGLEIARSIGVKKIALPSRDILLMEEEVVGDAGRWLAQGSMHAEELVFLKRYGVVKDFLSRSPQFRVFEWDGKTP